MKVITLPVRLVVRLVVLPIKLVLATTGLTFKAGLKVGALPFKGGIAATRALGFKAVVLFVLGAVGGVAAARKFGLLGGDASSAGVAVSGNGSSATSALVVEDTVVVEETAAGTVVSETVTVDEVDLTPAHADGSPLEQVRGASSEEDAELVVDIDAEVAEALGETPGEHA
jgi:hypothetical protein